MTLLDVTTMKIALHGSGKDPEILYLMLKSNGAAHQVMCADDWSKKQPLDDHNVAWPPATTTINVTLGTDSEIITRFFNRGHSRGETQ